MRALLLASLLLVAAIPARAQDIFTTSALVRSLLPTVVNITAYVPPQETGGAGAGQVQMSTERRDLGSGFIIDPGGTIVTNYHVVERAAGIVVTFSDGGQAIAALKEADRLADIAILHVQTQHALKPVRWSPDDSLHVGDPVIAIGNPLGVGMSVTSGIVSALNRNIMETPYDDYIQTDAPINHGNSGGPLFNLKGEVVGINTAIISPTSGSAGVGFAMPTADARFVIGQLEKYGWIRPGWIGLKVQQITADLANAFGLPDTKGAIVAAVREGGPAQRAGLQAGDIVETYQGRRPADERALLREIGRTPPGTEAHVTVLRAGKHLTLAVTVAEYPRQSWEKRDLPVRRLETSLKVPPDLGLQLSPIPEADRVRLGIAPEEPALLVAGVEPGTEAAWRGLAQGDAIERVEDQPVATPQAFRDVVDAVRAKNRDYVAVLVAKPHPVHPGPEWMALRLKPIG